MPLVKCSVCGKFKSVMSVENGEWVCEDHMKVPVYNSWRRGFWKGNKGYRR